MSAFWFIPSSTSRSEHLQQSEGEKSFFSEKRASPFFNGAAKNSGSKGNGTIQAKLTVGPSNDAYEKEADTMADKVVQRQPLKQFADQPPPFFQMRNSNVQRKCAACEAEEHKEKEEEAIQPKHEALVQKCDCDKEDADKNEIQQKQEEKKEGELVQPKCAACEKEEEQVQTKPSDNGGELNGKVAHQLQSGKKSGNSLPDNVQHEMGSSFGADFSNVRVHTDSDAASMNKQLRAQAFTHGSDIYFNEGKYNPGSASGKHLLAHELTHTVQQGHSPANGTVQRAEELDCDKKDKDKGSQEEAKANETTQDTGHCIVTDKPVEQPPKDKKKPKEEEQPKNIEANAGAGVDERQGHAPPAEKDAPPKEEGVKEKAKDEKPAGPCDPKPAQAGGGAPATKGVQTAQGAGTPVVANQGGATASPNATQGGGQAQGNANATGAEGGTAEGKAGGAGKGKGEAQEGDTGFLKSVTAQGVSSMINPNGLGEAASPALQAQRDEVMLQEQSAGGSLQARDNAVNQLSSRGISYLRPVQEEGRAMDPEILKDHDRSTMIANAFLTDTTRRLREFISQGNNTAETFRQKRQDSRKTVEDEITARRTETQGVFATLRANANAKSEAALQQVQARYALTVGQVNVKFILSNLALVAAKIAAEPKLQQALTTQLTKLDEVYTTGYDKLIDTGNEMGLDASNRASRHAAAYRRAEGASPDVQDRVRHKKKDGFWDGYLTYNRYMARADSAGETGKQYKEGMEKQAKTQADDMLCGKSVDIEVVNLIAEEGTKTLQCTYDNAVEAVKRNRDAALMQAEHARQQLTTAIRDSLQATLTQLREKEAAQLQLITDYGIRQAMAVERDVTTAIHSFITGVNEAAGKVLEVLTAFSTESGNMLAPSSLELDEQLRGMQSQVDGAIGQASGALDNSATGTEGHVDTSTTQSQTALGSMCAEGLAGAYELSASFDSSIDSLSANTQSTYDQLWTTVSEAIDGETTSGTTQIAAIVTAITELYGKLNTGLAERFTESATNMKIGMQKSLNDDFDKKICTEAEKAAADVQPWWKTVLKILLIIIVIVIVIVVVGPAIIAAVGGLAASAAGALGASVALAGTIGAWVGAVVGGAIVGALSGAVIQVGNNLIDAIGNGPLTWDKVTKGVWGAIVAGAIGGALGGLGGKFAQLLIGRLATVGISSGYQVVAKYGVELAFDVVGSVLGDLANGNPITLEGIVKGAVIGIIVQKSMGGLGNRAKIGRQTTAGGGKATRFQRFAAKVESIQSGAAAKGEAFGGGVGSKLGGKSADWSTEALKTAREAEIPKGPSEQRPSTTEEPGVTKPVEEGVPAKTSAPEAAPPAKQPTDQPADATAPKEGAPGTRVDEPAPKATADADSVKVNETPGNTRAEQELPGGHKRVVDKNLDVEGCSQCDLLKKRYADLKKKGLFKNTISDDELDGLISKFEETKTEYVKQYGDEILNPPTKANRNERLAGGKTRQEIYQEYLARVEAIEKQIVPHLDTPRLLVVGDATFEYVKALKNKLKTPEEITGTGVESRQKAQEISENQGLKLPAEGRQPTPAKGPGLTIEHGVDATNLKQNYPPDSFDRIIFNNPEVPGKESAVNKMLDGFLGSAPSVLKPGGEVNIGVTGSSQAKGVLHLDAMVKSGTVTINGRTYQVTKIDASAFPYKAEYNARRTEGGRLRTSKGPKYYYIFKLL